MSKTSKKVNTFFTFLKIIKCYWSKNIKQQENYAFFKTLSRKRASIFTSVSFFVIYVPQMFL